MLVAADALDEVSENFEEASPSATRVKVRDRYVELPPRKEDFAEWILTRDYPEPVTFADLSRYLAYE
jgi:hypothetical protein